MSALLALSDVLVYRALERCYSRALSGDARRMADEQGIPRHLAYLRFPITSTRYAHALAGSWDVTVEIVWRWQLPIEAPDWATVLDRYCRRLLTNRTPHTLDDLHEALKLLGAGYAA